MEYVFFSYEKDLVDCFIYDAQPLSALTNLVFRFTSASLLQADNNDRAC